jgi:hypothetical protein
MTLGSSPPRPAALALPARQRSFAIATARPGVDGVDVRQLRPRVSGGSRRRVCLGGPRRALSAPQCPGWERALWRHRNRPGPAEPLARAWQIARRRHSDAMERTSVLARRAGTVRDTSQFTRRLQTPSRPRQETAYSRFGRPPCARFAGGMSPRGAAGSRRDTGGVDFIGVDRESRGRAGDGRSAAVWSAAWGKHSCGMPFASAASTVPEPPWKTRCRTQEEAASAGCSA